MIHREAALDHDGIFHFSVESEYQKSSNLLRILPPAGVRIGETAIAQSLRQVYILPVNPAEDTRWGDGLETARQLNLHNRFAFVLVAPSFSDWPWYADHPFDPARRQESYLIKEILPLVDQLLPGSGERRGALGFSKSGFGALSLILRNPDLFQAASAWDAPLMKIRPDEYEMPDLYGNHQNFDSYCIPYLLTRRADYFRRTNRLYIAGYDVFRRSMNEAHQLMVELEILHDYEDGPYRKHRWDSGWMEAAASALHVKL